ncbi:1-phosphatidylinositol 4,5-bisphosphate phosphodiesterase 1 [Tolypocladium ophioglossoides CBS 100239]|uniref:Phosphoinositide phospholipase C n=1 Tax=Tolypocladium ophioglossoides (strain CBS 100239) TaxID=1163406 RepID=A0A0L0NCZ5_TOLOC|nr:1-phosphatidylinositol 4,5-bisphosphate phosphodiesterase 1 [Tolypocladium ophioglossoides CBS 100239]
MTSHQPADPPRSSLSAQLRRARPGQVQTNFHPSQQQPYQHPFAVPVPAISASSAASSSRHGSPIMSPETAVLTTDSSIQASPEPIRPRDDDQCPPNFQLPDSILSRKTSANSLGHSWVSSTSPIAEAVYNYSNGITPTASNTASTATTNNTGKGNLIRRLSSRASRRIASRRRQSSATPASRDGSVGPCFLRRRSDSNTTAPPENAAMSTDSESDLDERDDFASIRSMYLDGAPRGSSANSTNGSIAGSANNMAGPVIPLQLQRGTWLRKISKKNRSKRIRLVYEPETNKLTWDRARPNKFLHVDEIREIRTGSDIQQYGRDFNIPESERSTWFSILYSIPEKSKTKFLHLIADDVETCFTWTTFLDAMLKHRQEAMTSLMTFSDRAIAQYWQSEMIRQFGDQPRSEAHEEMDIAGVMQVCQNLHIYSSQSTLQANFRLCDARRRERLNFPEFLDFVRLMRQRSDVQRIMRSIAAKPEVGLTLPEFLNFLRDVQGEDVDSNLSLWERHYIKFVRKHRADDAEGFAADYNGMSIMSEAAFVSFLASQHNGPLADEPLEYTLDRPMNEYFISSSHNTYLLGRQVAGQSSVEGYIAALARGCRCVEVDCWDGSDGQPQVVHGRTLTTAISFKEVMTTINKYAFVKSGFPLWISLEVHCSPAQQALMVDIMKEAFGARLVTEPLDLISDKLPSPSELMGRILIKVKKPGGNHDSSMAEVAGRRRGGSLSSPLSKPTIPDVSAFTPSQSLPQSPLLAASAQARRLVSKSRVNTITEGEVHDLLSSSTSDNESGSEIGSIGRSANKTTKVLGALGVYCAGVKYFGFDTPAAKAFNHIFSFMETSFAKHSRTKESKMALDIHNMRYLMRVYPDGMRFASSNFDPLIYWRRGVQMAALNWQTFDLGTQLNHAMFEGGKDESGYVLKPPELRDIQVRPFDSAIAEGKKERSVVSFSIDVISAQQLMRPANLSASKSMDPYVEVQVFHANDKRDKKEAGSTLLYDHDTPLNFQTEVIRENGFNPMFSGGQFRFKVTTKHPELIFVRWSVKLASYGESYNSKDGAAIATYTAKLKNLRQGYRTLPLLNHAGDQYLFSTLFCKITLDPIETRLFDVPPLTQDVRKLNRLGGKVFGRANTSPRSTFEKNSIEKSSTEKSSFDSYP